MKNRIIGYCTLILCTVLTIACSSSGEHSHSESNDDHTGHEHGEGDMLSLNMFTDSTEVFVKYQPLIKENLCEITALLTDLNTYTPITSGKLTFSLITENKGIRQTIQSPESPGIYNLTLRPVISGDALLVIELESADRKEKWIAEGIKIHENEELAYHSDYNNNSKSGITYTKQEAWQNEFATEVLLKKDFNNIIRCSGELMHAQAEEIQVVSQADGVFMFGKSNIAPGLYIRKGDVIGTISGKGVGDNPEIQYKVAIANYNKAKSDFARAEKLVDESVISQEEYTRFELDYKKALAEYNAISAKHISGGLGVIAEISGYINKISVSEGEYVNTGSELFTIIKNNKLVIRADVSLRYFQILPEIASANFITPSNKVAYSTSELNGKVLSYGKSLSKGYMIPVFFEIDNPGNILPGSFVEVFLKTGIIKNTVVVPNSAILEEQGKYFIFVQTSGETYEKRYLIPGMSDGINTQVTSGVSEGERIVVKGAVRVKLAALKSELPSHGHAH